MSPPYSAASVDNINAALGDLSFTPDADYYGPAEL